MLSITFSRGELTVRVNLRGFAALWRLVALAVHEFCYLGIHPMGRSARSIVRRNALRVPL